MAAVHPTTMFWSVRTDLAEVANPGRTAVLDLNRVPCPPPYVLEGTAETVWRALGPTPKPTAEVVAEVAAAYDIEADAIATDVIGFLTMLVDLGLVARTTSAPARPTGTRLGIRALGVRWVVDLTSVPPELADRLARLWQRAAVDPTGDERPFRIAPATVRLPIDSSGVPQGVHLDSPAALPYAFSRALTLASLSALGGEALLLHAAALASADGRRAVVLVGASGAGKSTAVLRLGQRFGYVTDEAVAVTDDLTVRSYPKPVSLDPGSLDPGWLDPVSVDPDSRGADSRGTDKVERSPDELGLAATPAAPRVAAVVQLCRSSGVAQPRLDRIGVLDGVLHVLPETSAIDKLPDPLHRLVAVLRAGGGPYRLTYADIGDCIELIAGVLAESEPASALTEEAAESGGEPSFPAQQPTAGGPGRIVRAPCSDAVEEAGEIVVLRGRQPYRLSGIGASIWQLTADPLSPQQLTEAVIRRHGAHPDAGRLVAQSVDELVRLGLLLAPPAVGPA